jgi:hypothetical protein
VAPLTGSKVSSESMLARLANREHKAKVKTSVPYPKLLDEEEPTVLVCPERVPGNDSTSPRFACSNDKCFVKNLRTRWNAVLGKEDEYMTLKLAMKSQPRKKAAI